MDVWFFDQRITFPDTPLEHWEQYYDIFPEYFAKPYFLLNLGVFLMRSGGKTLVADTGVWTAWSDVGCGYTG